MTNVVVVPPDGLGVVYDQNRRWAMQYQGADPAERAVIEMGGSTPDDVLEATAAAVARAGASGRVIFAVGHGGAGTEPSGGQFDLAPNRAFRVTQFLVYDEDLTHTWHSTYSVRHLEQTYLEAAGTEGSDARARARRSWIRTYAEAEGPAAWDQVGELATLRPYYERWCSLFRGSGLASVILLTCNVANAEDFLLEVATDMDVTVRAFTERVMSGVVRRGGERRVVMFLDGDEPGVRTNNDRADVELMSGAEHWQSLTRNPRPASRRDRPFPSHVPGALDEH